MPYDCFISYSSSDLELAEALHRRIVDEHLTVWFDKVRLDPGCDWHKEIEQGCENSRVLLPILTPRWKASEWTRFETYGAESVVPLVCEGTWADVMTPPLERFQADVFYISAVEEADWSRLFNRVRHLLSQPVPQRQSRLVDLKYRVNDYFVGRDLDLLRIHEELHRNPTTVLTQGRVRAITAMGGVGKTTLARHYAEKFWRCYRQMFWVDARNGLEAEFARVHDLLYPDRADIGLKQEDKAAQALQALSSPNERLLIIDNAEDEESTKAWIPATGGCHTLITSRYRSWSAAIATVALDVLTEEAAVEFLQVRANRAPSQAELASCKLLAQKLGYLPLALETAAAYIKNLSLSFDDYLQIYEESARGLLEMQEPGSTEHLNSVVVTLQPSISRIGPSARTILHLASIIATTAILINLFSANPALILQRINALSSPAVVDMPANYKLWLLNQIKSLVDYSLISFDGQNIGLHPLLLTVQYETQPVEERRENWFVMAQLLVSTAPTPTWIIDRREQWTLENDQRWVRLGPQVERMLSVQSETPGLPFDASFELLVVNYYASQASYPEAITHCRSLCDKLGNEPDVAFEFLIEARTCLANLLKQNDQYSEGLEEFRAVHQLIVEQRGENDLEALRAQHSAACLMELLEDTEGAEKLMRDVWERRKSLLGEDHYDTTVSMHDVGWLLNNHTERLDEAEPLLRQAFTKWKSTLGVTSPDTRDAGENLSRLLKQEKRYTEAIEIQTDLVENARRVYGPDHLTCFKLMHDLSLFEAQSWHLEKARDLVQEVLAGYRKYLPPNNRNMLTAMQDLGAILNELGEEEEGEALLREALAGYESTQEAGSEDILRTLGNLAHALTKKARIEEAMDFQRRYVEAVEARDGMDNAGTLTSYTNYSHQMRIAGMPEKAEEKERRVIEATAKLFGDLHPITIHRRNNLALSLIMQNKLGEAGEILEANWLSNLPPRANVTPRIAFLLYTISLLESHPSARYLGQVKTLLTGPELDIAIEVARTWDIAYYTDYLRKHLPEADVEFLSALIAALNDRETVPNLDEFPQWKDQPPAPLDTPWAAQIA